MKKWYVAKTKPKKEHLVESYLTIQQDVDVFIPYIYRPENKKGGSEILFPSYIFCYVDPQSNDWGAIRYAPGMLYFLGAGNELVPVSEALIDELKSRVSHWNNSQVLSEFNRGDIVTIAKGPFAGLEAIFQRYIPARQRCQILVEMLGQINKAEISLSDIRVVSQRRQFAFAS